MKVTPDELAILRLLAEGSTVRQVARLVGVSERTIGRRLKALCDRVGVETPIEAVVAAVRAELL